MGDFRPPHDSYGSIQRATISPRTFFRDDDIAPPRTPKRFYMLFLFFMACFAQGIVWTPLSALPTEALFAVAAVRRPRPIKIPGGAPALPDPPSLRFLSWFCGCRKNSVTFSTFQTFRTF